MAAELLFFALFAAAVGVAILLGYRANRRRVEALRKLAADRQWEFVELDRHDRPARYRDFSPFGQGSARQARCCLVAGDGREAFQYQYTVQSGKSSHTYVHTVATARMPLDAPRLTVRREGLGHKLFDALGGEDIDFESDAFSRRFWVRCESRRFAYDVLHPGLIEAWLARGEGWFLQWTGPTLVLVTQRRLTPETALEGLELLETVRSSLPRHLLAAQRT